MKIVVIFEFVQLAQRVFFYISQKLTHINFVLLNVTPSLYCAAQSQPPLCRSIPLAPYALSCYTVGWCYLSRGVEWSWMELNGATLSHMELNGADRAKWSWMEQNGAVSFYTSCALGTLLLHSGLVLPQFWSWMDQLGAEWSWLELNEAERAKWIWMEPNGAEWSQMELCLSITLAPYALSYYTMCYTVG